MMCVIFNKCCFCIELKSGNLIIGYQNLIGDIFFILKLILDMGAFILVTGKANNKEFQEAQVDVQRKGDFKYAAMETMPVITILFLAFTIVLLVGLHKNKRGHVKAYLIYALIFIFLCIILFFVNLSGLVDARYLVWQVVNIILGIYFLLVIGSYYQKMNNPANKPEFYNTA